MLLEVYVPRSNASGSVRNISPGSAIVGRPTGERVTVYYEGGIYGQYGTLPPDDKFETFLAIASGRLVEKYPTIAMMSVTSDKLVRVGTYDTEGKTLVVNNPALLDEWKGNQVG